MKNFQSGHDNHVADGDVIEQRVGEIWREVLGPGAEGPGATFFDLQGQSISAVRIIARIEDELGIVVDVASLFEDPDLPQFLTMVMQHAGHRS